MIAIHATYSGENIELKDDTLREMVKYLDGSHIEFEQAALKVHRKTVFEVLIQLLRYCPVITGRLRGSWTPYLDKWGKQSAYARFLSDASLVTHRVRGAYARTKNTLKRLAGVDEVSEGKRLGYYQDSGLMTTVGSNVAYAASVNEQSGYLDKAAQAASFIIDQNFTQFMEASRKVGWIPTDYKDDPKPVE